MTGVWPILFWFTKEVIDAMHMPITSICPKVMEHILFFNIMQHLDKNSILMDAQHGFHKWHSCKTQLITITEDMACNLSNNTQIDAVFLDFVKSLDKVPPLVPPSQN